MNTTTYKRCEFIIRQFMSVEKPTEELLARFHGWLLDGRHCREKNVVIRRLFYESLLDTAVPAQPLSVPNPQPRPNNVPPPDNEFLEKLLAVKNGLSTTKMNF